MIRLSLVMIVKNEAELLPGFLSHHEQLAEEIIVVDTGSTDGTGDLARQAGAKVICFDWSDDFAAARNAGLNGAQGDWILILDADEVVDPVDFSGLRGLLEHGVARVMIQETINYCSDPAHLEWRPVVGNYPERELGQTGYFSARRAGLFPNRPDLRFSGRIHESILPAAQAAGLPVEEISAPVHHFGYVQSRGVNSRRKARYLKLAALKYAEAPLDWASVLELATAHLENGSVKQAIELLEDLVEGTPGLRPVVRGHFLLGRIRREEGNLKAASVLLEKAVDQDPSFLFGWLELIRCRAVEDRWSSVAELLDRARSTFGSEDPLLAKENLRLLIKTGQLSLAAAQAGKLESQFPHWKEIVALSQRLSQIADSSGTAGNS
ncbi:MAG: glycosyltransferase [Gemmatimonadales bacterium]|nr:glycosyltransferase [Gemmatimonadales bacterium]